MERPAVLQFPLRGEWAALNSPADKVPSHGTDDYGQRYAIDLYQIDPTTSFPSRGSLARHLLTYLPADSFLCWDAPVHAPADGQVVGIGDGWRDRMRVNLPLELIRATLFPPDPHPYDFRPLTGNYVLIESNHGVMMSGHLRNGSICVAPGNDVIAGDEIGRVGNSGNTTMPHLHFQLMDSSEPSEASGLPFLFEGLQVLEGEKWVDSAPMVPRAGQRFRSL